jgi:hypothetical protein
MPGFIPLALKHSLKNLSHEFGASVKQLSSDQRPVVYKLTIFLGGSRIILAVTILNTPLNETLPLAPNSPAD